MTFKSVAIVGVGKVGTYIVDAFVNNGRYKVTVLGRANSSVSAQKADKHQEWESKGVHLDSIDYDNHADLVSKLKGNWKKREQYYYLPFLSLCWVIGKMLVMFRNWCCCLHYLIELWPSSNCFDWCGKGSWSKAIHTFWLWRRYRTTSVIYFPTLTFGMLLMLSSTLTDNIILSFHSNIASAFHSSLQRKKSVTIYDKAGCNIHSFKLDRSTNLLSGLVLMSKTRRRQYLVLLIKRFLTQHWQILVVMSWLHLIIPQRETLFWF